MSFPSELGPEANISVDLNKINYCVTCCRLVGFIELEKLSPVGASVIVGLPGSKFELPDLFTWLDKADRAARMGQVIKILFSPLKPTD